MKQVVEMDNVEKECTLLTETYLVEYRPSLDVIHPYVKIIEHKTRPKLEEVRLRERYQRPLSAVLNSKPRDPTMDKNHSAIKTLH